MCIGFQCATCRSRQCVASLDVCIRVAQSATEVSILPARICRHGEASNSDDELGVMVGGPQTSVARVIITEVAAE